MTMKIEDFDASLFDEEESKRNQKKVVEDGASPFAPLDGICFFCGKNIYVPLFKHSERCPYTIVPMADAKLVTGITKEEAKKIVTGCPHCRKTFCGNNGI